MSKENLNLTMTNVTGKCDSKCSYSFKYSESGSTAKNDGTMITLTYDSAKVPSVTFNQQKYNVGSIMITSPSVHTFNNELLSGEMIITHNPVKGGNSLDVCIPLKSSSASSTASQILADIIKKVAEKAPSSGDSTSLNMTFNLQNIVPKKPFFYYTAGTTDTIVFGELDAIPVNPDIMDSLEEILEPYPKKIPIAELFYNSNGPTSGLELGDGVYISCQPTGSSEEETPVEYDKTTPTSKSIDFSNMLENPVVETIIYILIGCVLIGIIFYGISFFYSYTNSGNIKIPFISSNT
jgi:hypothetical protein